MAHLNIMVRFNIWLERGSKILVYVYSIGGGRVPEIKNYVYEFT